MGNFCGKDSTQERAEGPGRALTVEDLRNALAPLENKIDSVQQSLQQNIMSLSDALLSTRGDEMGKKVTVAVRRVGRPSEAICHGFLFRPRQAKDDLSQEGNVVYFFSAAHSIVDLTLDHEDSATTFDINWCFHKGNGVKTKLEKIFLPKEYVLIGTNDIGVAKFKLVTQHGDEVAPLSFLNVELSDLELVGKLLVGHGCVFLRGTVLSYSSQNESDSRMLVGTPSLPGCSGCPLFDGRGMLAAIVHGGVKHRGGRVLHNTSSTTSSRSSSSSSSENVHVDCPTSCLYADMTTKATSFFEIPPAFYKKLQAAESIDIKLAAKPKDTTVYKAAAGEQLKNMFPHAKTLASAMRELHDVIWNNDNGEAVHFCDTQLECLVLDEARE